jgi:hypothetical protein
MDEMSENHSVEPIAVPVTTARHMIGVGNTLLYELLASGDLKSIRIGRRRLILVESIRRLIADRAV